MPYSTSIGLDVHARSISAAAYIFETGELVEATFGYDAEAVAKWAEGLPEPKAALYESGPTGFDLKRKLDALGLPCHVGAVSKMRKAPGDRVKTDRRDAAYLARLLMVGDYVECVPPTPRMEAARDLSRIREDAREDLMDARHQLSKMLLRHGYVWPAGRASWTKAHRDWLKGIHLAEPTAQYVLEEYMERIRECEARKARLDEAIADRAKEEDVAGIVQRLCLLRGISTLTAFGIAAEIGDFARFRTAQGFMSYVGLVPSEYSSGSSVARGPITKTGNSHVRRLLEGQHAAPQPGPASQEARQEGLRREHSGRPRACGLRLGARPVRIACGPCCPPTCTIQPIHIPARASAPSLTGHIPAARLQSEARGEIRGSAMHSGSRLRPAASAYRRF